MRSSIFDTAKELYNKYRTNNPYELAEELGIVVKYRHFKDLKGMYKVIGRVSFIWLHDDLDEITEKVVLMHEIGHHIFHRAIAASTFQEFSLYDMAGKPEVEANVFAANMLISDKELIEIAEEHYTSEQASSMLGLPHQLVLIKIQDMIDRGYGLCLGYGIRYDFLGF